MTLRLVLPGPGRAELVDEPDGELPDGAVRIATAFTGLSAGTELSWYKGTNPFLDRHFDAELGVFAAGAPASPYPVTRVGYMETGTVLESRTAALPVGTPDHVLTTKLFCTSTARSSRCECRSSGQSVAAKFAACIGCVMSVA